MFQKLSHFFWKIETLCYGKLILLLTMNNDYAFNFPSQAFKRSFLLSNNLLLWLNQPETNHTTRIEVPEIISAEQHCFRDLTFFSADSENMKTSALINSASEEISAVQRFSGNEQLWNKSENYSDSELISAECLWGVNPSSFNHYILRPAWHTQR